jgi:hypothetical protein
MKKENTKPGRELLKCDLPPREALRRAMNVKPPENWKASMKISKSLNVKKATQ